MIRILLRVIFIFLPLVYLGLGALLYFSQDAIVFPAAFAPKSWHSNKARLASIEEFRVKTSDDEELVVWRSPVLNEADKLPFVAIIFHGNGETIHTRNFMPFFNSLGVTAYNFDYRGFGDSTGYPSEEGLYRDAEAVWQFVSQKEGIDAKQVILLGNSLGSGPSSYLASKIHPKGLILVAGYSSLVSVASSQILYRPFSFLLKHKFPTSEYIAKLTDTCTIFVHGKDDEVIPFSELRKLTDSISPNLPHHILVSDVAMHNNVYYTLEEQLKLVTKICLSQ